MMLLLLLDPAFMRIQSILGIVNTLIIVSLFLTGHPISLFSIHAGNPSRMHKTSFAINLD